MHFLTFLNSFIAFLCFFEYHIYPVFSLKDIFNQKKVLSSYNEFLKYGSNNTFHIWQWINLESFFKIFVDSSLEKFNIFKGNIEEEKI